VERAQSGAEELDLHASADADEDDVDEEADIDPLAARRDGEPAGGAVVAARVPVVACECAARPIAALRL
jgi:hypothetical protein